MTLFKKVFQSHSQPATSEDVLDEEALRRAFTEAEETADPLKLDPFEFVENKASDDEFVEEDTDHIEIIQPEAAENEDSDADESQLIDGDVLHEEETSDERRDEFHPEDHVEGDDLVDEEPVEEDVAQSDEEIAACLDRALAAEIPDTGGVADTLEDTEEPEAEVEVADEVYEVADSQDQDENDAPAEELDLKLFAQKQMAVLEDDDKADAVDEVENADEPDLDLSSGVSAGLDAVPVPAAGRAGRRAGRVKTRLLGFNRTGDAEHDPFGQAPEATASAQREKYPVGWLVIVEGPGVGHSFSIFTGASMIGRGEDQVIRLDFGDNSISRNNHAAIAYDEEQNKFYIGHGGKSNIIRRNARPVLSTEELHHADLIRIGETTLRFVALCGSDFQWNISGASGGYSV